MSEFMSAVVNGWWQGVLLTFLVWLVLRDLPRLSAATRLAIWHVTLLVVILLPALQRIRLPEWQRVVPVELEERRLPSRPVQRMTEAAPIPDMPVTARSQPLVELPQDGLPEFFIVVAIVLAVLQLLRLAFGYWVVRRLKRKATPAGFALPVWTSRQVDVLLSDRISMPMAVGYKRPAVLLPRNLMERLTPEQLHHVLLHESAHLMRRDDWMALAERFVRAIFFFQPAVYWIGQQIEREREIACDDWVLQQAGEPRRYATSLARLAELGSLGREPMLATGAGKALFARMETLLDRTRNRLTSVSEPLVMLAGLVILLAVYQGSRFNHIFGFDGYSSRWVESDGSHRKELKMRGEIRFASSDLDVETMSPGAKLVVQQTDGWRVRTVEFSADEFGNIHRSYFTDGIARPFDDEARRFLAKILPQWIREQGHDIPERMARMIASKGEAGALEDIRTVRRSDVKRRYIEEYLVQASPSAWEMGRILKIAGEMDSDHEKRRFFENIRDRYLDRGLDSQTLAFIDGINSDDDRRQLLSHAIERSALSEPGTARLLRSVGRISSDDAKAGLLRKAAQLSKSRPTSAFYDVVATIHSDNDRERLLTTVLSFHGDDPETIAQVLHSAGPISSDHHKANVVVASARNFGGSQEMLREASRVLSSIHSDDQRRRCLEAFLESDGNSADTVREMLLQAISINSDHEKSRVLMRAAGSFPEQEQVRRAFFSAVNSIHSSHDQRRVLMAVVARPAVEAETLREVSRSASQISSDQDQAAILKALAERR